MKATNRAIILVCLAVCLVPAAAPADGPVLLRYKFGKGQNLRYNMVMEQDMDISTSAAPGMAQKIKMHMDMGMYQKVTGVEKGAAVLEVGFSKFDAVMEMMGNKMPLPGAEGMKKMRISMRMTDRGEISDAKLANTDELEQVVKQMAESMKKSINQNSLIFPEKGLKTGDSWTIEQEIPADLPGAPDLKMKVKSVYKLTGFEPCQKSKCAKIGAAVEASLKGKGEQGGIPTQADMKGSGTGENLFDPARGCMVSSKVKIQVGGDVLAQASEQQVSSQIKMGINMKMDLQ